MTNWNPTRFNLIGVAAVGLLALVSNTQSAAGADSTTPSPGNPFSIGAEVGTTGIGGTVGYRFTGNLGVETGFDYFGYSYSSTIKDDTYHAKLRLMSQPLNLDVYPWERSSFHFAIGALFNENRLTGNNTGLVKLGDSTPQYAGSLSLKYKQNVADPYLGIGGNLYFDKAKHWSLMGALGVAYVGDGSVSLTSTPNPNPTALQHEQNKIKSYARDLEFWPVAKIGLTYSF